MKFSYLDKNQTMVQKLMNTNKLIFHRVHEQLEEVGLYRGQPRLLFALWEQDGQSKKALTDYTGRQAATITKMVGRLEKNGFVRTEKDSKDSRISRVFLTENGKALEKPVRGIFKQLEESVMKDFSEDELQVLDELMTRIRENIESQERKRG